MADIQDLRAYLRINHSLTDSEITDLIEAAKADLVIGGIKPEKVADESDPLIKKALVGYLKGNYGLDNEDAEKYQASYERLRDRLALSSDYGVHETEG